LQCISNLVINHDIETKYKRLVVQLVEILEKNRDGEGGYKKAADNAESLHLKSCFQNKTTGRAEFSNIIKCEMVANYNDIDDDSSITGSIPRAWMDVKPAFSADNEIDVGGGNPWR